MPPKYPCITVWPPLPLSYFTTILVIIMTPFIVVGNFLICLAVAKDPFKNLRTPFMYFIVNAAVSDFLMGTVTMPAVTYVHILEITRSKTEFTKNLSTGHIPFYILSSASIFSVAALSLERYVCVVHPFVYRQKLNFKKCFCISGLIWILSIGLALLYIKVGHRIYHMIYLHYSVAMILGVLIFTYVRIHQKVKESRRKVSDVTISLTPTQIHTISQDKSRRLSNNNNFIRQRKQDVVHLALKATVARLQAFTRLLLSILTLYSVLYMPVLALSYIGEFCLEWNCDTRHVLRDFVYILVAATSAINPFMCTLRLRPFREAIKAILCKKPDNDVFQIGRSQNYVSEARDVNLRRLRSNTQETIT